MASDLKNIEYFLATGISMNFTKVSAHQVYVDH